MKLKMPAKDIIAYIILIATGIVSIFLIQAVQSPVIHILTMWCICFEAILIVKFDLMHPYFWFSVIFSLYSTAYAILFVMGARNYGYSYQNILFPVVALMVVLLVVGPSKRGTKGRIAIAKKIDTIDNKYFSWLVYAFIVLTALSSVVLLIRGYSGKTEMKAANDLFYRFGVYFVRFLTFFVLVRVYNLNRQGKSFYKILVFSTIVIVLFGLCTGERDVYIRFFVVGMFCLYSINKIKKRHFIILIPVCAGLLILSVGFKYFFSQGVESQYFTGNLLVTILNSDFYAAGQNLQYLLDRPWTNGYFGFGTLFTEILYPIIPGGMKVNLDYWFNYEVHFNGWHGYAFTLVGTGYAIAGLIGIISVFAIVGLVIRALYKKSSKSQLFSVVYLYSITIVMISCRGTLSSYANSFLKEVAVACAIKYLMDQMFLSRMRNRMLS